MSKSESHPTFPDSRLITRWQLNRAGIVNVYQYENETFEFGGGRLLLRGINGSGKSTAMNMLLPFLLTGRTRGIDAAGEQTGVLKSWMLSGRDEPQPVGYLWIEFARRKNDSDNGSFSDQLLVLGCGIKANRSTDSVSTWWFVTSKRPGIDLQLVEQGVPLAASSLNLAIEPEPVFTQDRRTDYRREVVRQLYGGADLDAYLQLLNTVRNPRVGDRVDVDLPEYLVAALPQLSDQALTEAARPLDDLDEHRRNVADLDKTAVALGAIQEVYQNYVLTELTLKKEQCIDVLKAADNALKEETRAHKRSEQAVVSELAAQDHVAQLESGHRQLTEEINALRSSSAYTDGQQLEDLRTSVADLEDRVEDQSRQVADYTARLEDVADSVHRSESRVDADLVELSGGLNSLSSSITYTALTERAPAPPSLTRSIIEGTALSVPDSAYTAKSIASQLTSVGGCARLRKADIDDVRKQITVVNLLQTDLRDSSAQLAYANSHVQDANGKFDESQRQLLQVRREWDQAVIDWSVGASTHAVRHSTETPMIAQLANGATPESISSTTDRQEQRQTLVAEFNLVCDHSNHLLAVAETGLDTSQQQEVEARLVLEELNTRSEPDPPLLHWQQRDGQCLADLVDFADNLDADKCAGLEAALEASGLLSASFGEDGLRLDSGELVAVAGVPVEHPIASFLTVTLPADVSDQVSAELILGVLNSISTSLDSTASTVITTRGDFRLGALNGRHEKPLAEYIGAGARRARLERLRAAAATAYKDMQVARLESEQQRDKLLTLRNELVIVHSAIPSLDAINASQAVVSTTEDQLEFSRLQQADSEKARAQIERQLATATDELDRIARTLKLPTDRAEIDRFDQTLDSIVVECKSAQKLAETLERSCRDWDNAVQLWQTAKQDLQLANQRLTSDRIKLETQSTRLKTLDEHIGVAYHKVVAALEDCQASLGKTSQQLPSAREKVTDAVRDHESAKNNAVQAVNFRQSRDIECKRVHASLLDLLNVPGLLEAIQAVVDTQSVGAEIPLSSGADGRHLELITTTADTEGLRELLQYITDNIQVAAKDDTTADSVRASLRRRRDSLGAGWDAEDRQPDPALPASIAVNGPLGKMTLADSLQAVRTQLEQLTSLLTQKQDQALRTLLQGQVAREVAEKMHQASALVSRMNDRLESVTTTHGIGVRLRWRRSPELDEATAGTVSILAKLPDLRSENEEAVLRQSLSARLDEARRLEPDAPYRDLIAQVFDFRRWYEMSVLLRRGDAPERKLTRKTPLSEGEKKLVTYLPLFAAVAAACDALADVGGVDVPRFVLLDDAFAKVSEDNHARLFGLLVDLELDFIATSERLWGTHATVPALAITEVVRDNEAGVILLEHSRWNGTQLSSYGQG